MWTHNIFLLFAFCFGVVLTGSGDGTDGKASDLQIVYDELATLTRITNAITLQSAALKKSVKVRDVITELLKVDPQNFTNLINYIPEALSASIQRLKDKTVDLANLVPNDWKILESGREWLSTVKEGYDSASRIRDFEFQDFFDLLYKNEELFPCPDVIQNVPKSDDLDSQKSQNWLVQNTQPILNCFKNLKKDSTNFRKIESNIDHFLALNTLLDTFQTLEKLQIQSSNFSKILEKMFKITKPLWSIDKKNGIFFQQAVESLNSMFPIASHSEIVLTLGFPEKGDMAKVVDDLKIWRLDENNELSWKEFEDGFIERKNLAVRKSVELGRLYKLGGDNPQGKMDTISKFAKNYKDHCSNMKNLNPTETKEFQDSGLNSMVDLGKKFVEVGNLLTKISKEIQENELNSDLEKLKSSKNEQYPTLTSFVSNFGELSKLRKDISKHIQNMAKNYNKDVMATNTTNTLNSIKSVRECFKKLEKSDPGTLLDITSYLKTVHAVSNGAEILEIQDVLKLFTVMRDHVSEAEQFVKNIGPNYYKEKHQPNNPILKLENPQEMILSLGRGMMVLRDMTRAWNLRDTILEATKFSGNFNTRTMQYVKAPSVQTIWPERQKKFQKLVSELKELNNFAGPIKDKGLLTMRKILDDATKVHGFPEVFKYLAAYFSDKDKEFEVIQKLAQIDMDFASQKGYLHAASLSFDELRLYFDDIFGISENPHHEVEHNYLTAALICLAVFLAILITVVLIFALTKSGRKRIRKLYFYYFAKPEDFEKRWRYSLFMDRVEGKNALHDAVREINPTNTLKRLKKGAYINVFNRMFHGNTPLHVATKRGYPDIVEILIKNGADRTYLNAQNKTPEQMIPQNWRISQTTQTEATEKFEDVERVYKKYRNKKFRPRVPEEFPSSSFHIYIEDTVDDALTNEFMKKHPSKLFQPTTTHCIVKTDSDGILESDAIEMVFWILSGVIIVRDTWLSDCLKNEKLIEKDSAYLVERVRYKGTIYDTVIQWSNAMAKGAMPYLYGVYVAVLIPEYPSQYCEHFKTRIKPKRFSETSPFLLLPSPSDDHKLNPKDYVKTEDSAPPSWQQQFIAKFGKVVELALRAIHVFQQQDEQTQEKAPTTLPDWQGVWIDGKRETPGINIYTWSDGYTKGYKAFEKKWARISGVDHEGLIQDCLVVSTVPSQEILHDVDCEYGAGIQHGVVCGYKLE
ncbi:Protein CBG00014 [Caenorhabditis briggsae]|uniref:Protein CBG00014 n=1 Tax=Caenorhabditis briggsae TaxID=6238 RepID=A8WM50_CAEBR|nr:Protein CBG00014 [Caenorhabditis briggsae]CAP21554.2 Protein CBG00014 [Caenorhabditis briggsae]